MIVLIAGGTHTGKTLLAQRFLEKYHYPYLSIDHLKMGLIRSGYCPLTPESDREALTRYLWPVVLEIIKTAIENGQNLIVEGCYIPFDYKDYFEPNYLRQIQYGCLVFSESYIQKHYADIVAHRGQIECRGDDSTLAKSMLLEENLENLNACRRHGLNYVLIDDAYEIGWDPLA